MLSKREKEILTLISEGHNSRDIANRLGISIRTVETHRKNISHKYGGRNLFNVLKIALQAGLIK